MKFGIGALITAVLLSAVGCFLLVSMLWWCYHMGYDSAVEDSCPAYVHVADCNCEGGDCVWYTGETIKSAVTCTVCCCLGFALLCWAAYGIGVCWGNREVGCCCDCDDIPSCVCAVSGHEEDHPTSQGE